MKRKEQIEKAATDYINSDAVSPMNMQLAFGDFINGAKWADKTMIEKACEVLDEMTEGRLGKRFLNEFRMHLEE